MDSRLNLVGDDREMEEANDAVGEDDAVATAVVDDVVVVVEDDDAQPILRHRLR